MANDQTLPQFVIERTFDAPKHLVWKAFTDPELVSVWYGPGVETIIHQFDLKPGGAWHNEMKMGEMSDLSKMVFVDIVEGEKLVWHASSADKDWNVISNGRMPDWPKILHTEVTFEEDGDSTKVVLTWTPHEATDAEIACFEQAMEGFGSGWGKGFDLVADIVAKLKAE